MRLVALRLICQHWGLLRYKIRRIDISFIFSLSVNSPPYCGACQSCFKRISVFITRTRKWNTWMLHHDNSPCHTALSVTQFLSKKKKQIVVILQPPYSPDLSPCDVSSFPKIPILSIKHTILEPSITFKKL